MKVQKAILTQPLSSALAVVVHFVGQGQRANVAEAIGGCLLQYGVLGAHHVCGTSSGIGKGEKRGGAAGVVCVRVAREQCVAAASRTTRNQRKPSLCSSPIRGRTTPARCIVMQFAGSLES